MKDLYSMIFKRKSFHMFNDTGHISDMELMQIKEAFHACKPLLSEIKVGMKIVPAEQTTCKRGQEYCILLFSEEKEGYLPNIGYIGEQLDLNLVSMNIGTLWFGIGKTEETMDDMRFIIMIAIAKMPENKFRRDMFKSKRKPLDEVWSGNDLNIANIVRFAPSACNTQPWIVKNEDDHLEVYRYKKQGKRGIMPKDRVSFYNRIDIGIFLLFLEVCMEHKGIGFERTLYTDYGDEEKTLVATYQMI